MKKIYFVLSAMAMLLSCMTASAQFVNQGGVRSSAASEEVESLFNTVDFTYSPLTFRIGDDDGSYSQSMNAVSLNWAQARSVSSAYPIYLQYGAGLQYAWLSDSDYTLSFLTAKIPVNLMYYFAVPNTNVALMPYAGINLQGHILGQGGYDGETESLFDSDDEGGFNRFVLGWQIGAKVMFDRYVLSLAYEGPVTNLYKYSDTKINTSQVNISVGIKF